MSIGRHDSDEERYVNDVMRLMVPVPGGTVELRDFVNANKWLSSDYTLSNPGTGSNKNVVSWTEVIEAFYVMKYPVTQCLYDFVMRSEVTLEMNSLPATEVSWLDSITFCNALSLQAGRTACYSITDRSEDTNYDTTANGFRLLSDAEWQYVCKAGTRGYRYGKIDEISWYEDNSHGMAHPVGELVPNPWGIYDMIGNVWEWCWDLYDTERYGNYRVFRGGGWADVENSCGSTVRRKSMPDFKADDLGFRIALSSAR